VEKKCFNIFNILKILISSNLCKKPKYGKNKISFKQCKFFLDGLLGIYKNLISIKNVQTEVTLIHRYVKYSHNFSLNVI
jgi:hypothetical protein